MSENKTLILQDAYYLGKKKPQATDEILILLDAAISHQFIAT